MWKAIKIEVGQKFGKWTAIEISHQDKSGRYYWKVQCECGRTNKVRSSDLHLYKTKQCANCSGIGVRKNQYTVAFNGLLKSAKDRKIEVAITIEDYRIIAESTDICHYCNATLMWVKYSGRGSSNAYNLDRKDFKQGYILDNIVPCCKRCNRGKMNLWSYEEWRRMTACFREDYKKTKGETKE